MMLLLKFDARCSVKRNPVSIRRRTQPLYQIGVPRSIQLALKLQF